MNHKRAFFPIVAGILAILMIGGVSAVGTYPAVDPDMVLYYHFNNDSAYGENDTFVYDFSGKGNNGTINANVTINLTGSILGDGFFNFNRSANFVKVLNSPSLNLSSQLTIGFWIRTTTIAPLEEDIVAKNTQYRVVIPAGASRVDLVLTGTSDTIETGTGAINDGNWHYVVFTYDGVNMKNYIDGINTDTEPSTGNLTYSSENLFIGSQNGLQNFLNGSVDEVIILNRSLTGNEVWDYYQTYSPIVIKDDLEIPYNTTLVNGVYYINNSGLRGILRFSTNSNVALNCNNSTIIGNNTGSLDVTNDSAVFISNNIYNITVYNCNFYNFRDAIKSFGAGGDFYNNSLKNSLQGIALSFGSSINGHNKIHNNVFDNNFYSVKIENGTNYNLVYNNTILNTRWDAIEVVGAYNNISYNIINDSNHAGIDFLSLDNSPSAIYNNIIEYNVLNRITGSFPVNNYSSVFHVYMGKNNIFRHNIFTGGYTNSSTVGMCINLRGNVSIGLSENNVFLNNTFSGDVNELITLGNSNNNSLINNTFVNFNLLTSRRGYSYYLEGNVTNTTIIYNILNIQFFDLFNGGIISLEDYFFVNNTSPSLSSNLSLKFLLNALLYNINSSIYGNSDISLNDGNVNITLNPNDFCYVLDNFNLTEGNYRQYSPIWFSSSSPTSKHIASNLTDAVNVTIITNLGDCTIKSYLKYTPNGGTALEWYGENAKSICEQLKTTGVTLQVNPSASSNEFEWIDGSNQMASNVLRIVVGLISLLILVIAISGFVIYIKNNLSALAPMDILKLGVTILICIVLGGALAEYIYNSI